MDTIPQGSGTSITLSGSQILTQRGGHPCSPGQNVSQQRSKIKSKTSRKSTAQGSTPSREPFKPKNNRQDTQYYHYKGESPRVWDHIPPRSPPHHTSYGQGNSNFQQGRDGNFEYNIPTQNRFFPLSDSIGPSSFGPRQGGIYGNWDRNIRSDQTIPRVLRNIGPI